MYISILGLPACNECIVEVQMIQRGFLFRYLERCFVGFFSPVSLRYSIQIFVEIKQDLSCSAIILCSLPTLFREQIDSLHLPKACCF